MRFNKCPECKSADIEQELGGKEEARSGGKLVQRLHGLCNECGAEWSRTSGSSHRVTNFTPRHEIRETKAGSRAVKKAFFEKETGVAEAHNSCATPLDDEKIAPRLDRNPLVIDPFA